MSDTGNVNGIVIDSPTPNSYVVGVSIAADEAVPSPTAGPSAAPKASKGSKEMSDTPEQPDPEPEPDEPAPA
jgi:hypothetical protein